jgi:uncharacterized protein
MSDDPDDGLLPETLPIFPLTGALLMPQGRLPLFIFEPRYLAMIEDAIKGDRLIGMVQPVEADAEERQHEPPVHATGCAGRITQFKETPDSRFEIVLEGVSRFDIESELEGRNGYRVVAANWERFADDRAVDESLDSAVRSRLLQSLDKFLAVRGVVPDDGAIDALTGAELVAAIAMACPFHAIEKQAVLESKGIADRAMLLTTLLDMAAHGDGNHISRQ